MTTPSEFQALIASVAGELATDVKKLLSRLNSLSQSEALAFITDAYPGLATPYATLASGLTAQWYEDRPGPAGFVARTVDPDPVEKLATSGRWALVQHDPISALQGSATRAVFNAQRETVIANAERENTRWARHASATACGFCRALATRGAVYQSQASAKRAHDKCHCLAVPDRDGSYEPAPYVEKWVRDYEIAQSKSDGSLRSIAAAMDRLAG